MALFTGNYNWYVCSDPTIGKKYTDGGLGTKESPFLELEDVAAHPSSAANHTVGITGYFTKAPATTAKQFVWIGEGQAIIDGFNLPDGTEFFVVANAKSFRGIRFIFFQGASLAASFKVNPASAFVAEDCRFDYCNLRAANYTAVRCIFNECVFNGSNANSLLPLLEYCTFTNCQGQMVDGAAPITFVIRNNIFHNCLNLRFGAAGVNNLPVTRPANSEFNYNNISGSGLGLKATTAEWRAHGDGSYQSGGTSYPVEDLFNDYSAGRDDLTYYMNDYSLKLTSPVKDASKEGIELGAKRVAFYLGASNLWANYKASSTNLSYSASRGIILLDTVVGVGTFESTVIDLGSEYVFDMLNFATQFVYANGVAKQFIDQNADMAGNLSTRERTSYDIDLAYSNTLSGLDSTSWRKVEINQVVRVDSASKGNADDTYNAAAGARVAGRYVKIRFSLRANA